MTNRQFSGLLLSVLVIAILGGLIGARLWTGSTVLAEGDDEIFKAKAIHVIDKDGNSKIIMDVDEYGDPRLEIKDSKGNLIMLKQGEEAALRKQFEEGIEIVKSDTGLQYQVLEEGTGDVVAVRSDKVTVHYRGWLLDGTEFDSSYKRGEPVTFPLTGVIAGWTEGVSGMKIGEKRRLVIPADLGYGPRAQGPIPANSILVFDVELVKIN